MENPEVAQVFEEVADLLDIQGENPFRVRAYRNAARTIRDLSAPLAQMPPERLEDLPGIGKDLAGKIQTLLKAGDLPLRQELSRQLPSGLHPTAPPGPGAGAESQRIWRLPRQEACRRTHRGGSRRGGRSALDSARAARGPWRDRIGPERSAPQAPGVGRPAWRLHMHTTATDGRASLEEMVRAAKKRGYAVRQPIPRGVVRRLV